jgi:hypothetical protein
LHPNQALQLTAGRRESSQNFMRKFSMLPTLGVASGS